MRPGKHFHTTFWLSSCVLLIVVLAGCSSSSPAPTQPKPSAKTVIGASNCQPPSPITTSATGQPEVRGTTGGNTELWALLFSTVTVRQEAKIVWRMGGSGDMQIVAQGPGGVSVQPKWIQFHDGGSNWNRPGAEWGTGFTLPSSGCWDFHATRGSASGDVWLLIK